ncbi:hypothetical protein XBFFL1_2550055 [Xenorhabdus bovienii str. feltiae Florida]|nr:hypothetical protein XBFFL1_2550055 [Xenorhabdus bovienii str. feltiae Florida]
MLMASAVDTPSLNHLKKQAVKNTDAIQAPVHIMLSHC